MAQARKASSKKGTGGKGEQPRRRKAPAAKKQQAKQAGPQGGRVRRFLRRVVRTAVTLALLFVLFSAGSAFAMRYVNPSTTPLMVLRHMQYGGDPPIQHAWRDMEDIAPEAAVAVLAAEDQRFPKHHGFDLREMRFALADWLRGGELRGASTLSQQVARNVYLTPYGSWARKVLEAWFTVWIELFWSKERILEVYLNIAEMGEGIFGVEAAALSAFGKPAAGLTAEEAAAIAAVLPNPIQRSIIAPDPATKSRQAWILGQMRNLGGAWYLEEL